MSIVNTTTGHSAPQERKIAKILFAALIFATLVGILFFVILGQKDSMNPTDGTTAVPMNGATPDTSTPTNP